MDGQAGTSPAPDKGQKKTWSRLAVVLGILACLASPFAWYFGLSLLAAFVAMVFAFAGFLRGERSKAAWFWPILALVLGALVYSFYLRLTGPVDQGQAQQVLKNNFAGSFEADFADLVGDAGHKSPADEDAGTKGSW